MICSLNTPTLTFHWFQKRICSLNNTCRCLSTSIWVNEFVIKSAVMTSVGVYFSSTWLSSRFSRMKGNFVSICFDLLCITGFVAFSIQLWLSSPIWVGFCCLITKFFYKISKTNHFFWCKFLAQRLTRWQWHCRLLLDLLTNSSITESKLEISTTLKTLIVLVSTPICICFTH